MYPVPKVIKERKVIGERLVRLDLEDARVRHLLSLALLVRKVNGENSPMYLGLKELLESLSKESVATPVLSVLRAYEDREVLEEWTDLEVQIQPFPDLSAYAVCPVCLASLPTRFKTSSVG